MEVEGSAWPLALQDTETHNLHLGGAWRGDMRRFVNDLLLTPLFLPLLQDDGDS